MKLFVTMIMLASFTPGAALADSLLRIKCDDKDVGAEVYVNDKYVGECPVTPPAPPGNVTLRARKVVNGDYERLYSKQIRVIDGVPQVIEIALSAPQMTEDAKRRKAIKEFTAKLSVAESGDIEAMKQVAESFDNGIGVKQNSAQAMSWRVKAEEAERLRQKEISEAFLREANQGNVFAMKEIADRYEKGIGVAKNDPEAQAWLNKAYEREVESAAAEKKRIKKQKLDKIDFFEITNTAHEKFSAPILTTLFPIIYAEALLFDLTSAPSRTTELNEIQNEAALHPSTWGKPDSMIAKVSMQHQADRSATNNQKVAMARQ